MSRTTPCCGRWTATMSDKKQRRQRDHKNYDYLTITAKVEREEEIIASYATLGWETVEITEDKRFFDLDTIEFRRPHKIENKDRLQLLQVKLETLLNKFGVLEHKKKAKSTTFGLVGGIFGCIALAAGIALLVTELGRIAAVITAIILLVAGLSLLTVVAVFMKRVLETEARDYAEKKKNVLNGIYEICRQADALRGVNDDRA